MELTHHRYFMISPVKFYCSDIVEVQVLFHTVPLKDKKYKMLVVLHALTLLDKTPTKVRSIPLPLT